MLQMRAEPRLANSLWGRQGAELQDFTRNLVEKQALQVDDREGPTPKKIVDACRRHHAGAA